MINALEKPQILIKLLAVDQFEEDLRGYAEPIYRKFKDLTGK